MKKLFTLSALLVGLGWSATAQENTKEQKSEVRQDIERVGPVRTHQAKDPVVKSAEERAQMWTNRVDKSLELTDGQKEELYAFHLAKAEKQMERREEQRALREIRKQEMKEERQAFERILTPEQKEKLGELAASKKDKFKRKGRHFKHHGSRKKAVQTVEPTNNQETVDPQRNQ